MPPRRWSLKRGSDCASFLSYVCIKFCPCFLISSKELKHVRHFKQVFPILFQMILTPLHCPSEVSRIRSNSARFRSNARAGEKWRSPVTGVRVQCPRRRKMAPPGHWGTSPMPAQAKNGVPRSLGCESNARAGEKWRPPVTGVRVQCPRRRKMAFPGHWGASPMPAQAKKSAPRSLERESNARAGEKERSPVTGVEVLGPIFGHQCHQSQSVRR